MYDLQGFLLVMCERVVTLVCNSKETIYEFDYDRCAAQFFKGSHEYS